MTKSLSLQQYKHMSMLYERHSFSSMGGLLQWRCLRDVVVLEDYGAVERVLTCVRARHNHYTVVMTKAEMVVEHLPHKTSNFNLMSINSFGHESSYFGTPLTLKILYL